MRRNICIKSTLRQPLRAALLFMLIGAVSFTFISRMVEYVIIAREGDRLSGYYRSIGMLIPDDPDEWDISDGAEVVAASGHVAYDDIRRSYSGVLDGIYNADISGGIDTTPEKFESLSKHAADEDIDYFHEHPLHIGDVFMYARLSKVTETGKPARRGAGGRRNPLAAPTSGAKAYYELEFDVESIISGHPENALVGQQLTALFFPEYWSDAAPQLGDMETGSLYLIRTYYNTIFTYDIPRPTTRLRTLTDDGPLFLKADSGAGMDIGAFELAGLEAEIALTRENQHAMNVLTTRDMSAMEIVQESSRSHYLVDGRWIDFEDDRSGNRVCVVNNIFAELRGLSPDDTIKLNLRMLNYNAYGYITDEGDRAHWQGYPTHEEEFEIVGLFGQTDAQLASSPAYVNNIYIPDSCCPFDYTISSGLASYAYSFILKSSRYQEAFLSDTKDALADLGMSAQFLENGFNTFWDSQKPIRQSTALSAWVTGLLAVLALALSAVLYTRMRRKEFAILRGLGSPAGAAAMKMLTPITMIAVVASIAGGLLSWNRTLLKAAETLSAISGPVGVAVTADLPVIWLAGLCAGIFMMQALLAALGSLILARRPILALLSGITAQTRRERKQGLPKHGASPADPNAAKRMKVASAESHDGISTQATDTRESSNTQAQSAKLPASALARQISRSVRRSALKSALAAAVALGAILALGRMHMSILRFSAEIDYLYGSTVVDGAIIPRGGVLSVENALNGLISKKTVDSILDTGIVESTYLEAGAIGGLSNSDIHRANELPGAVEDWAEGGGAMETIHFFAFNDSSRFFAASGGGASIIYAEGWDGSVFSMEWVPVRRLQMPAPIPAVMPASLCEQWGMNLGDTFNPYVPKFSGDREFAIVGIYTGEVSICGISDDTTILLPWDAMAGLQGDGLMYSTAEFIIDRTKNRELVAAHNDMVAIAGNADAGPVALRLLIWDEELRTVVAPMEKTLQLLSVLYPIAIIASILIAMILASLQTLSKAKEAAIMLVLGVTKPQVCAAMCVEQIALCIAGLLPGIAAIAYISGFSVAVSTCLICASLYFAGDLLGSLGASMIVTGRKPLELLQAKE